MNTPIKPTVVMLHGMASSKQDWVTLTPVLIQAGYPAYALDLLGHGDGNKPASSAGYHFEAYFQDFDNWLAAQSLGDPLVFIGHSLGGFLSLVYTLRYPERVKGMVLISPLYSPRQLSPVLRFFRQRPQIGASAIRRAPGWLIHLGLELQSRSIQPLPPEARRQMAQDTLRVSPYVFHITNTLPEIEPRLPEISVPTLIIWGQRDLSLNPRMFPRLADLLKNSNSRVVASAGHEPHRAYPGIVNGYIQDFLTRI